MNKEFIPYEQALELKELGFDEPCLAYWFNETPTNPQGQCIVYYKKPWDNEKIVKGVIREYCSAPTFSQAFRFFREKYKIGTWIHHYFNRDKGHFEYSWVITLPYKDDGYIYEAYEEAELACLKKLIEIVKQ